MSLSKFKRHDDSLPPSVSSKHSSAVFLLKARVLCGARTRQVLLEEEEGEEAVVMISTFRSRGVCSHFDRSIAWSPRSPRFRRFHTHSHRLLTQPILIY